MAARMATRRLGGPFAAALALFQALPAALGDGDAEAESCAAGPDGRGCTAAAGAPPLWPRARGHLGSYSVVNLTGPWDLSKPSLVWYPGGAAYRDVVLCGPLVDADGNLYVTSVLAIHKLAPDGSRIWNSTLGGAQFADCPSLDGGRLFGTDKAGYVFSMDTRSGEVLWRRKHGLGLSGDTSYVEVHEGVVIYEGNAKPPAFAESPSVLAVDAETGNLLWEFVPDTPVWNLMAIFPQDGTVVFQDYNARTYRLGLHNGSLLWKAGGAKDQTWTDGGCILGNNGVVYAVSSKAQVMNHHPKSGGGVHAYDLATGRLLWEKHLERPVFTWPAVGRLAGRSDLSVIIGVGSNGYFPLNAVFWGPFWALLRTGLCLGLAAWALRALARWSRRWSLLKCLVKGAVLGLALNGIASLIYVSGILVPIGSFQAEIYAFDAATGKQQWVFEIPEWKRWYSAGDWEGFDERTRSVPDRSICLPAAYNSPTIDAAGTVYMGFMSGVLYALRDANGDGRVSGEGEVSEVDTRDAFLHSGVSLTPGLMAVTNCDALYVWRT